LAKARLHSIPVVVAKVDRLPRNQNRKVLDEFETASGHISIGTMHLAKGLEFRAVAVMACDDVPLQERIETVGDERFAYNSPRRYDCKATVSDFVC
jgi:superfamily I DNA/RNA helicase